MDAKANYFTILALSLELQKYCGQEVQINYNDFIKTIVILEMQKTDFEKVKDFNIVFGVPVSETPQLDLFTSNQKLVKLRLDLIREELKELEEAVKNHDIIETVDALADLIYVVHGMGCSLGLNLDKAFDIVHKSNMSKVCKNEEEAQETVEHYKKNFATLGYDSPAYRKSSDGNYWIIYNYNTGKILKSINYTPAKFDELLSSRVKI